MRPSIWTSRVDSCFLYLRFYPIGESVRKRFWTLVKVWTVIMPVCCYASNLVWTFAKSCMTFATKGSISIPMHAIAANLVRI